MSLVLNSPYGLSYYPSDSQTFNEVKKSLYSLALAAGNACFSTQSSYDYLSLFKYQGIYEPKLAEKIAKLHSAEKYLQEAYLKYQQDMVNYKNSLAIPKPALPLSDNVEVNQDFL